MFFHKNISFASKALNLLDRAYLEGVVLVREALVYYFINSREVTIAELLDYFKVVIYETFFELLQRGVRILHFFAL